MNQKRKLEIDKMAEGVVKDLTPYKIGYIGILLWSIIEDGKDELSNGEIKEIRMIANDSEDDILPMQVKKFLLSISNNIEEMKYFISRMQNNIIRKLEQNEEISAEEIERLRGLFTVESLKKYCVNRRSRAIRILVTAVAFDNFIQFEEYQGISKKICDLITELPMETIVHIDDAICEAYSIIYDF